MLHIRQVKHLARQLGITVAQLDQTIDAIPSCCENLDLIDPNKPGRHRTVLKVSGQFRKLQDRMLRQVLLPRIKPTPFSFGGVKGRSIRHNALAHVRSRFAFATDISNFYPSVSNNRVYRLFVDEFDCTPDVARMCTRLCTHEHHLALGLPTSPIIADCILRPIDARIGRAAARLGLVYTRFVDDLIASGTFDLCQGKSGFPALVVRILGEHGLEANSSKNRFGRMSEGFEITGIQLRNGRINASERHLEKLERQLTDGKVLAMGGQPEGGYFTSAQVLGLLRFVCWINPNRKRELMARFKSIEWDVAEERGRDLGLVSSRKLLQKAAE